MLTKTVRWGTWAALACAALAALTRPALALTAPPETEKSDMFYFVGAHPDDEINSWSLAAAQDDSTYMVMATLTQGEGTTSCLRAEDAKNGAHATEDLTFVEGFEGSVGEPASGPHKYQGPNSHVGEDDMGEREPFGFPWKGQSTKACKDARIASWHWFLDDMFELDGTGTSFEIEDNPWKDDNYLGHLCGEDRSDKRLCADVWADEHGARVAFDLGNTLAIPNPDDAGWTYAPPLFDSQDVVDVLVSLRAQRAEWGIPELPEIGIGSASGFYDGDVCAKDDNPDHFALQEALSTVDIGAGPQFGPIACEDQRGGGVGLVEVLSPKTLLDLQWVDPQTDMRIGPFNVNYGWLFSTYMYAKSADTYFKVFD